MMKIGYDCHMMVDIETLDTAATAVVLSVGAVVFNGYGLLNHYHWTLEIEPQLKDGRTISGDTLAWWMQQDPAIMREAFGQECEPKLVLDDLNRICTDMNVQRFWAHSPAFDYVILDHLYRSFERPWSHKSWLDTRTLSWLTGKEMRKFEGQHNAETDAIRQAEWVIEVLEGK